MASFLGTLWQKIKKQARGSGFQQEVFLNCYLQRETKNCRGLIGIDTFFTF
jgi:hypothetical protein